MGKLRIGYRETLPGKFKARHRLVKHVNKQDMWFELELEFLPILDENEDYKLNNEVVISFPRTPDFDKFWDEFQKKKQLSKKKKSADDNDEPALPRGQ